MPVVTMLNQKGGVGKTSTCYHLAGTLAQLGRRVLLVDNDPQASLTQGFLGPQATQLGAAETITAVYSQDAIAGQVVRNVGVPGIDLLAGNRLATDYNVPNPHEADWPTQVALRDFLADVAVGYDLVLIDCPPNLHLCSWAALVASNHLVVPLQPEDFGAQGIADVQESVDRVIGGPNPALSLLGFLITMHNARATVHQVFEQHSAPLRGGRVRDDDPDLARLQGGDHPAEARGPVQTTRGSRQGRQGASSPNWCHDWKGRGARAGRRQREPIWFGADVG